MTIDVLVTQSCLTLWLSCKESAYNAGDTENMGSVPVLERSPGGGNGSLIQYSCLGTPTDRGAWWAAVHRVTKRWTQLK